MVILKKNALKKGTPTRKPQFDLSTVSLSLSEISTRHKKSAGELRHTN